MFSSQEGHLYIRGGLLNFIVSLRFKLGWLLYTYQSENKKKGGEKKKRKGGRCEGSREWVGFI